MLKKTLTISLLLSLIIGLAPSFEIPTAKASVTPPAFVLYPASGSFYEACQTADIDVLINTNNTNTDSANIIIGYDDAVTSIQDDDPGLAGIQITPGTAYNNYASYTVNEVDDNILMTGYNVTSPYNSGSEYDVFGSFTLVPLSTGTANLTIDFTPAETIDSNIAEAITSNDILNAVENGSYSFIADGGAPYISNQNPAPSSSGVAINSNVYLRFRDNECGVNIDSLSVTVDGITYTKSGSPSFSYAGDTSNYLITINPSADFNYGENITVNVSGEDSEGNPLSTSYDFTTIYDTTPPSVSNLNPASGATNRLKSTNVAFRISDSQTGVDIDSLSINVEGITYTKSGPNTFSYTGGAAAYDITINPAVDFPTGATIDVAIDAEDLANNPMSTYTYSFSLDSTPPAISNRNPAADATNILKSTNVYFTISDNVASVDLSTVSVVVEGVTYTESGPNTFSYTGGGGSYNITINPAVDFIKGSTINVAIDGADTEGNVMSTMEYVFYLDNEPPVVTDLSPANNAEEVSKNTNITFTISDIGTNVDLNSVEATVKGITYTVSGYNVFEASGSGNSYDITINPAVDFTRGEVVSISIDGADTEGNVMSIINASFTVIANMIPTITYIPDKTVTAGNLLTFLIEASDEDGDTVSIEMSSDNLPPNATYTSISNERGIFTFTPTDEQIGNYSVNFTATDDGPGTGSYVETVAIQVQAAAPSGNNAPTITSLGDQTVYVGSVMNFLIHATDTDSDNITLQALTSQQAALTLVNLSNGLASLTVDSSKLTIGTNVITIHATDDGSPEASSEQNFTITVTALPESEECEICETCEVCETCEPTTCPTCPSCPTTPVIYGGGGGNPTSGGSDSNETPVYYPSNPNTPENDEEEEELVCPEPEEIIRYITVKEECDELAEDDTNDPTVLLYNTPKDQNESLLEPVIIVLGDEEGLYENSLSLSVNGKNVLFNHTHKSDKNYNLYTLTYSPVELYPEDSTIPVQIRYIQQGKDYSEYFKFSFKTGSSAPIFLEPEETKPNDVKITSLFINKNERFQIEALGETENASEIQIDWQGQETVQVIKKIKDNKFSVRSPIDFPVGTYSAKVVARNSDGVQSAPITVSFTIESNGNLTLVTNENVSIYKSAPPNGWQIWWRWILAILNTLLGQNLIGDSFPKGFQD